jgi:hypothetical protein
MPGHGKETAGCSWSTVERGRVTGRDGSVQQRYGKKHGKSRGITPHALKLQEGVQVSSSVSVSARSRLAYRSSYSLRGERADIPNRSEQKQNEAGRHASDCSERLSNVSKCSLHTCAPWVRGAGGLFSKRVDVAF